MGSSLSSTNSTTSASMSDDKTFIEKEIGSHEVVIFSKTYCGYCSRTKSIFAKGDLSKDVQVHELDRLPNGSSIQRALLQMTGQTTVPSVFVKGQHIGGNDDTQAAMRSGKLKSMLL